MKFRFVAAIVALTLPAPAYADCTDEACGSIQKILDARSGNFSKIKGKPALDPRGDPVLQGTQPIAGLMNACYIYKRGEGSRYEYRCETEPSQSLEEAKKVASVLKAAFQSAEPNLTWFEDPAVRALSEIEGFKGTEGWYGGFTKNKTVVVKIETIVSEGAGSINSITVFAKPLTRRDLR
jgi:hypothetical protein